MADLLDQIYNISIPGTEANSSDIGNIDNSIMSLEKNCDCETSVIPSIPLSSCVHPKQDKSFVFRGGPIQLVSPYKPKNDTTCLNYPTNSIHNGIRYNIFDDDAIDTELSQLAIERRGIHSRANLRNFNPDDVYLKGWDSVLGDAIGYSKGIQLTTETGLIQQGFILPEDVYKDITLKVEQTKDEKTATVWKCSGINGLHVKFITITYKEIKDNAQQLREGCGCDPRLNIVFRFDIGESDDTSSSSDSSSSSKLTGCTKDGFRSKKVMDQEGIIDNIMLKASKNPQKDDVEIQIEGGYMAADFLELYGPRVVITGVKVRCMTSSSFQRYAIRANDFVTSFDSKGRLFVFYEDIINYTDLPYITWECEPPPPPKPSSSSSSPPVGGDVSTGGPGGGGGIGGGPGGGGAGFRIPGGGPNHKQIPTPKPPKPPVPPILPPPPAPTSVPGRPPKPVPVAQPQNPCIGRDCLGCSSSNLKATNSYTISFAKFSAQELSWECEECDNTKESFIRILSKSLNRSFCLYANCNEDSGKECNWSNIYFIEALQYNCKNAGCPEEYDKVLLPFVINLAQNDKGWTLDAFVEGPDCKKYPLFYGTTIDNGDGRVSHDVFIDNVCSPPVALVNDTKHITEGSALHSTANCAIYGPPSVAYKYTGTISCAVSSDMGKTWYNYRGLIQITNDKMAVHPAVAFDPKKNEFHLFYTERDYIDDAATINQKFVDGFSGELRHVILQSEQFVEDDAYKPFWPLPSSSSSLAIEDYDKTVDGFLHEFTDAGKSNRLFRANVVIPDDGGDSIKLVSEYKSAYMDAEGRISVLRFMKAGTLINQAPKLTRLRKVRANCGLFTLSISGVEDNDCGCKALMGTFELDKQTDGNYGHPKWTLKPDSTGKYWQIVADEKKSEAKGLMIFQRRRLNTSCPPTGIYKAICQRCSGNIVATLDVAREVEIYNQDTLIANSKDFTNSVIIGPLGSLKTFTIKNPSTKTVKLTGTPIVKVLSDPANSFIVEQPASSNIEAGASVAFTIRSTKAPRGKISDTTTETQIIGSVRIDYNVDDKTGNSSPYEFKAIIGALTSSSSSGEAQSDGEIFPADSVGYIITSANNGRDWITKEGVKAGQWANIAYTPKEDMLFIIYVKDDMLFLRRYPAVVYSDYYDPSDPLFIPEDTKGIKKDSAIIFPNPDIFANVPAGLGDLLALPTFFDLPLIKVPGFEIPAESDGVSLLVTLENEKDHKGIPTFLIGNKQGTFINAQFPYPANFTFDYDTAIGASRPTAYISPRGRLRFFYIDSNGNLNGGSFNESRPTLDTKLAPL